VAQQTLLQTMQCFYYCWHCMPCSCRVQVL